MISDGVYGFFGWREFLSNRYEILFEFDRSKFKNQSRPVRVSHGNAAEAALREWLNDFLPKRFAVTSGFVIPNRIEDDYKLYHYDIIIYDQLESPVLWIDEDRDTSESGAHRAIPAEYVYGIYEVKSTFTKKDVKASIVKLSELNKLIKYLPKRYSCGTIFMEFVSKNSENRNALREMVSANTIHGFTGSMVMRCKDNENLSALIEIVPSSSSIDEDPPLFLDIDAFDIEMTHNDEGGEMIKPPKFVGMKLLFWDGAFHVSKMHVSWAIVGPLASEICWSYDMFSKFAIELLERLQGEQRSQKDQIRVGQVFHEVVDRGYGKVGVDLNGESLARVRK